MVHSLSVGRWRQPCARPAAAPAALLAGLLTAALTAHAQPAPKPTRADPLDPQASVPTLSYRSSFTPYRRLDDGKPVSWREANDTVARIGGWRVYAREAQQPDPAPEPKPAGPTPEKPATPSAAGNETAKPMPAGHGGHKTP